MRTGYKILPLALAFFLLPGCFLWEREEYTFIPHLVQEETSLQATALHADTEDSLRELIVNIIKNEMPRAVISVTDYPGELSKHTVSAMLKEIQTEEPAGAYAVEYIEFEYTRVLSQYTIELNITYNGADLSSVRSVSGKAPLNSAVREALREYKTSLTVEMMYFDRRDHDMEAMARAFAYENPAWAMELPVMELSLYPPKGEPLHRIAELTFKYRQTPAVLRSKTAMTEAAASAILEELPDFPLPDAEEWEGELPEPDTWMDAKTALWLYDTLRDRTVYDEETAQQALNTGERQGGDAYAAYGALVKDLAVSEGYAMAFKLLCDGLDMPCHVVTGRYNGIDHAWNLVRVGEIWYHIDTAFGLFLFGDGEAEGVYAWDRAAYPAADEEFTLAITAPIEYNEPDEDIE